MCSADALHIQQKLDETTKLLRDLQEAQKERLSAKQPPNMICLLAPSAKELELGEDLSLGKEIDQSINHSRNQAIHSCWFKLAPSVSGCVHTAHVANFSHVEIAFKVNEKMQNANIGAVSVFPLKIIERIWMFQGLFLVRKTPQWRKNVLFQQLLTQNCSQLSCTQRRDAHKSLIYSPSQFSSGES